MKGSLMQREWSMKILHLLSFTYISKYLLFFFGSRYSYTRGLHHWLALLQRQLSLTPVYCISHYSLCSSHYPLYACVCCLLAFFFLIFLFFVRPRRVLAPSHTNTSVCWIFARSLVYSVPCVLFIFIFHTWPIKFLSYTRAAVNDFFFFHFGCLFFFSFFVACHSCKESETEKKRSIFVFRYIHN